ncbi:MAG TPA: hypothetical protein VF275_05410 [Gammaproteobacteria bacterium]
MKTIYALIATLALIGLTAPVHADEIGPAYPLTDTSATSTTQDEGGFIAFFLSLFE